MKKFFLIFLCVLISFQFFAQTGIGTTTPDASAKLEVFSNNKGFLPPRVILTSVTDNTTVPNAAEGLLVYNKGSVGLQAGYYYWNGVNWATIATATSAGNGVTASEMVKIYDGVGNAAAINVNGATFSVTTSGRYSFDFSTSASCGNCIVTLNFQVRDGANSNAVIASDMQTSYSNNVHAEYNGKLEVNLIGGRSYNVLVTASSGNIYNNDYTRVYMKQVSGNLPVTGQSVDYVQASLSANQTLSAVGNIIFNTSSGTGITLSNGGFNLIANKTYKLEGSVGGSSTGYIYYAWVDASNTIINGGSIGGVMKAGGVFSDGPQDKAVAYYTPTSNTTVYLRVLTISGTSVAYATSSTPSYTSTWATINQIGSSAIINPWTLSGTNTYNTTGNVGIGTITPAEKLDVSGNVKATNFIGNGSQITGVPTNVTYAEIDVPQALAVANGFVDLANIPLPSAGKYKITYVVRASITTNGTLAVLALRNGSNTQVSGTEAMAVYNLSNVQVTCTQVCVVNPTAAETFKLSVWTQAGTGNFNVINDGNGRSKVLWEKIQ